LADKYSRKQLLLLGILMLTFTNLVVLCVPGQWGALLGVIFAGVHLGMTQSLIAALIAESTLKHLKGTAFAMYYLTAGVAVLIGNNAAGFLSDLTGSTTGAFLWGAFSTVLSAYILLRYGQYMKNREKD
jgi:MFS family permease